MCAIDALRFFSLQRSVRIAFIVDRIGNLVARYDIFYCLLLCFVRSFLLFWFCLQWVLFRHVLILVFRRAYKYMG